MCICWLRKLIGAFGSIGPDPMDVMYSKGATDRIRAWPVVGKLDAYRDYELLEWWR
jgi:hypothetical protein